MIAGWTFGTSHEASTAPLIKRTVRQLGLVGRGERQTLKGKSSKLNRISHTISGKLDKLPTDLDAKLFGSFRIKKRLMRTHYQPDRFKGLR